MKNHINFNFNVLTIVFIVSVLIGANYFNFAYKAFIPAVALISGMILTSIHNDNLIVSYTKKWSPQILSYSIILLGFGFKPGNILKVSIAGLSYTIISICGTLTLGLLIGCVLKTRGKISVLISSGTAICGGSAIAAISPIIRSSHEDTAIAMGSIFLLNAIGLLAFPILGHLLHLNQIQFGTLAALAIHDTSSVVGSCIAYGQEALIWGTTIKLVRAIWIIPISLAIAIIYSRMKQDSKPTTYQKSRKPWFIFWFILASLLIALIPSLQVVGEQLKHSGESLFMVALFFIGYNVPYTSIKSVGKKVLLQAVILWISVSIVVIAALKLNILG